MRRRSALALLVWVIVLGGAGLGAWVYQSLSKPAVNSAGSTASNDYIDPQMAGITKVGNQNTQDVTYPGGVKTKAIAGELLLQIKDPAVVKSFGSKLQYAGAPDTYTLQVTPGEDLLKAAQQVGKTPGVLQASPNFVDTSQAVAREIPNDPLFGNQDNLNEVSAPEAWTLQMAGGQLVRNSGVPIAVLDSGVDLAHPDLSGKIALNASNSTPGPTVDQNGASHQAGYYNDKNGMNFVPSDGSSVDAAGAWHNATSGAQDDYFHGTRVAGVAAAISNNNVGVSGMSWGSQIIPVKISDYTGYSTDLTFYQGVVYAVARGARVINYSLGRPCQGGATACDSPFQLDAIAYANQHSAIIVAASGNDGYSTVGAPADAAATHPGIIAVGASESSPSISGTDAISRASYSNYGSELSLVAPGDGNETTNCAACAPPPEANSSSSTANTDPGNPYTTNFIGTSAAAPQVAGVFAMMLAINPSLTPAQLAKIVEGTADFPAGGDHNQLGAGRLNAYKALYYTLNCPPPA